MNPLNEIIAVSKEPITPEEEAAIMADLQEDYEEQIRLLDE